MCEGETEECTHGDTSHNLKNSKKCPAESDINLRDPWKMWGKQINYKELSESGKIIDYKELTKPFLDEKEAGIVKITKEKVFMIVPDNDNCCNL